VTSGPLLISPENANAHALFQPSKDEAGRLRRIPRSCLSWRAERYRGQLQSRDKT